MDDLPARETKPRPIDLAIPVSELVQIESVRIIATRAKRADDELLARGGFTINHSFSGVVAEPDEAAKQVSVKIDFRLASLRDGEPEPDPTILIEATFLLIYSVNSLDGLKDVNLAAFGYTNGVYNAWPYWREYVQSTSVRMGLPAITAPVFRLDIRPTPPAKPPRGSGDATAEPSSPPNEGSGGVDEVKDDRPGSDPR